MVVLTRSRKRKLDAESASKVCLRGGTGRRKKFNNHQATVMSSARGGWVSMKVFIGEKGEFELIKWRSGSWTEVKIRETKTEGNTTLLQLSDLSLTLISQYLLSTEISSFTSSCKILNRFGKHTPSVWMHADFLAIKHTNQLLYLLWLVKVKARIQYLRLVVGMQELGLALWFIGACDLSALSEVYLDLCAHVNLLYCLYLHQEVFPY